MLLCQNIKQIIKMAWENDSSRRNVCDTTFATFRPLSIWIWYIWRSLVFAELTLNIWGRKCWPPSTPTQFRILSGDVGGDTTLKWRLQYWTGEGVPKKKTKGREVALLRQWQGEGVNKMRFFCRRHLSMAPYSFYSRGGGRGRSRHEYEMNLTFCCGGKSTKSDDGIANSIFPRPKPIVSALYRFGL